MYNNYLGVIYSLSDLLNDGADKLMDIGVKSVQINCWKPELMTRENAERALKLVEGKIIITSFWAGWSGSVVWNMIDGPLSWNRSPRIPF